MLPAHDEIDVNQANLQGTIEVLCKPKAALAAETGIQNLLAVWKRNIKLVIRQNNCCR